mgnify:CR=1 FL=1
MKVPFEAVETRFREGHAALIEAINAHTAATNSQTRLLEELCNEVKLTNEKACRRCTQALRFENIAGEVAAFSNALKGVAEKEGSVSSDVSSKNERVEDIKFVSEHKAHKVKMFQAFGVAF